MPMFIKLPNGDGEVLINLDQVCHVMGTIPDKVVVTFNAVLQDEPAYLIIDLSLKDFLSRLPQAVTI